jgi:hypothetical protein
MNELINETAALESHHQRLRRSCVDGFLYKSAYVATKHDVAGITNTVVLDEAQPTKKSVTIERAAALAEYFASSAD